MSFSSLSMSSKKEKEIKKGGEELEKGVTKLLFLEKAKNAKNSD